MNAPADRVIKILVDTCTVRDNSVFQGAIANILAECGFRAEYIIRPPMSAEQMVDDANQIQAHIFLTCMPTHVSIPQWHSIARGYNNSTQLIFNHIPNFRQLFYKNFALNYYTMHDLSRNVPFSFEFDTRSNPRLMAENMDLYDKYLAATCRNEGKLWIIKPSTGGSGRGIIICPRDEVLDRFKRSKTFSAVIQKYIENPLLHDGRKFHFRVHFMLMPRVDRARGALSGYDILLSPTHLVYTSTVPYTSDIQDRKAHLTNVGVQGHESEDQAIIAVQVVEPSLRAVGITLPGLDHELERMICTIFRAGNIVRILNPTLEVYGHELFGIDVMPDATGRLWLLEININPGIGLPKEHISRIGAVVMPAINDAMWREIFTRFGLVPPGAIKPQTFMKNIGFVPVDI